MRIRVLFVGTLEILISKTLVQIKKYLKLRSAIEAKPMKGTVSFTTKWVLSVLGSIGAAVAVKIFGSVVLLSLLTVVVPIALYYRRTR